MAGEKDKKPIIDVIKLDKEEQEKLIKEHLDTPDKKREILPDYDALSQRAAKNPDAETSADAINEIDALLAQSAPSASNTASQTTSTKITPPKTSAASVIYQQEIDPEEQEKLFKYHSQELARNKDKLRDINELIQEGAQHSGVDSTAAKMDEIDALLAQSSPSATQASAPVTPPPTSSVTPVASVAPEVRNNQAQINPVKIDNLINKNMDIMDQKIEASKMGPVRGPLYTIIESYNNSKKLNVTSNENKKHFDVVTANLEQFLKNIPNSTTRLNKNELKALDTILLSKPFKSLPSEDRKKLQHFYDNNKPSMFATIRATLFGSSPNKKEVTTSPVSPRPEKGKGRAP